MSIGNRIKEIRGESGLTQEAFSSKINMSRQHLGLIEKNKFKNLTVDTLLLIYRNFNISIDWLITGEGSKYRVGQMSNQELTELEQQAVALLQKLRQEQEGQ